MSAAPSDLEAIALRYPPMGTLQRELVSVYGYDNTPLLRPCSVCTYRNHNHRQTSTWKHSHRNRMCLSLRRNRHEVRGRHHCASSSPLFLTRSLLHQQHAARERHSLSAAVEAHLAGPRRLFLYHAHYFQNPPDFYTPRPAPRSDPPAPAFPPTPPPPSRPPAMLAPSPAPSPCETPHVVPPPRGESPRERCPRRPPRSASPAAVPPPGRTPPVPAARCARGGSAEAPSRPRVFPPTPRGTTPSRSPSRSPSAPRSSRASPALHTTGGMLCARRTGVRTPMGALSVSSSGESSRSGAAVESRRRCCLFHPRKVNRSGPHVHPIASMLPHVFARDSPSALTTQGVSGDACSVHRAGSDCLHLPHSLPWDPRLLLPLPISQDLSARDSLSAFACLHRSTQLHIRNEFVFAMNKSSLERSL